MQVGMHILFVNAKLKKEKQITFIYHKVEI